MSVIDWLRKLGILRFGAEAGTYRNAKERPDSLLMDDVYDSEKDVISLDKMTDERMSHDEPKQ